MPAAASGAARRSAVVSPLRGGAAVDVVGADDVQRVDEQRRAACRRRSPRRRSRPTVARRATRAHRASAARGGAARRRPGRVRELGRGAVDRGERVAKCPPIPGGRLRGGLMPVAERLGRPVRGVSRPSTALVAASSRRSVMPPSAEATTTSGPSCAAMRVRARDCLAVGERRAAELPHFQGVLPDRLPIQKGRTPRSWSLEGHEARGTVQSRRGSG